MNILHFGKYYPPYHGGMEHYLRDLAEQQVRQGHQVTVLVHNHRHGYLKSNTQVEQQKGVKIIRQAALRPLLFTPLMLGLNKTIKQLSQQKIDLIHIHTPNPSSFLLLLNRQAKQLTWLLQWHSDMVTQHSSGLLKLAYYLLRPLEKKLLKQSQMVLVSSDNYRTHSPPLQSCSKQVKILPLGINPKQIITENLPENWTEQQWDGNQLRLFSLGRLTFYKNQQMLVKAVKKADQCQLIIAGNGQLENRLKQQIRQQQLSQRVKLLKQLNWRQINALYQSSDIFCLASHDRAESYGMVLLEAMVHDKIILVADTVGSGMSWLAENYNKGFTFKANDVDDFVKQINYISEHLSQIKQRPKDFQLNIEKTAQQLNDYYQQISRSTR